MKIGDIKELVLFLEGKGCSENEVCEAVLAVIGKIKPGYSFNPQGKSKITLGELVQKAREYDGNS